MVTLTKLVIMVSLLQGVLPFKYKQITWTHSAIVVSVSWSLSIVFAVLALTLHIIQHHLTIIMVIMIGIVVIVLLFSNTAVFITAAKSDQLVRQNAGHRFPRGAIKEVLPRRRILRASYVCLAVVSSFLFCWIPYFAHNTMILVGVYAAESNKAFTIGAEQLALCNNIVDSLLFIVLTRDARRIIGKAFNIQRVCSGTQVRPWIIRKK